MVISNICYFLGSLRLFVYTTSHFRSIARPLSGNFAVGANTFRRELVGVKGEMGRNRCSHTFLWHVIALLYFFE